MVLNPLETLSAQPSVSKRSLAVETGLIIFHRNDLPGNLEGGEGFSHHLITFFLSDNQRQVTTIDRREYDGPMATGDFYLCPAGVPGRTSWSSADETFHLAIEPKLLHRVARETDGIDPDKLELLPVLKGRDRKIEHLVQLFLPELDSGNLAQTLYLESLSSMVCIHLLRQYCTVEPTLRQEDAGLAPYKLKLILDYIQAHLDSDLSLEQLAEQVSISRYHFARQFKKSMKVTPHQYVNQQRLEKAMQLLQSRKSSIVEIASVCGFSSQSHLTKVFRRHTGTTPKAYQDRL